MTISMNEVSPGDLSEGRRREGMRNYVGDKLLISNVEIVSI